MNFKEAIQKLKDGKKITRDCWMDGNYWVLGSDEAICWKDGRSAVLHVNQINADDYKVFEENTKKMCLHTIRLEVGNIINHLDRIEEALNRLEGIPNKNDL